MRGGVGWYRKDFKLPSSASQFSWVIRFESVNYRTRVWLNGKPLGSNTGAYLPFEFVVPSKALNRGGTNRLVVRVDSRRTRKDFPPAGDNVAGSAIGGWWNYSGILREVYLRRVQGSDFSAVQVRPVLPCSTCPATMRFTALVRNAGTTAAPDPRDRPLRRRPPSTSARGRCAPAPPREFTGSLRVPHPEAVVARQPDAVPGDADRGRRRKYSLKTGIRSISVVGRPPAPQRPPAELPRRRPARGLQAVRLRDQQPDPRPVHRLDAGARRDADPQPLPAAPLPRGAGRPARDHALVGDPGLPGAHRVPEVPQRPAARREDAARTTSSTNGVAPVDHRLVDPERAQLARRPVAVGADRAGRRGSRTRMDPSRPVGLAVAAYPSAPCQAGYGPLDVLGFNDYFGWYPGPGGTLADEDGLRRTSTAFAPATRTRRSSSPRPGRRPTATGPRRRRAPTRSSRTFANFHFGVYATKPWLSGAIWWGLQEFRVRPTWDGGNPRPSSPIHTEGPDHAGRRQEARILRAAAHLPCALSKSARR